YLMTVKRTLSSSPAENDLRLNTCLRTLAGRKTGPIERPRLRYLDRIQKRSPLQSSCRRASVGKHFSIWMMQTGRNGSALATVRRSFLFQVQDAFLCVDIHSEIAQEV